MGLGRLDRSGRLRGAEIIVSRAENQAIRPRSIGGVGTVQTHVSDAGLKMEGNGRSREMGGLKLEMIPCGRDP